MPPWYVWYCMIVGGALGSLQFMGTGSFWTRVWISFFWPCIIGAILALTLQALTDERLDR